MESKKLKLESLKSKRIFNLNSIVGGSNGITDGTNTPKIPWEELKPKSASCSGGCSVIYLSNGDSSPTGPNWSYDY